MSTTTPQAARHPTPPPPLSPARASPPQGSARTALWIGAVIAVIAVAIFGYLLTREEKAHPAAARPTIEVTGTTVAIAPDAPQWRYVEIAVAKEEEPLTPLPSPGRVSFDLGRTAPVGTPLAGRVDRVMVRTGDSLKKGAHLFSVRSGAWAELEKEAETAKMEVAVKKRLSDRARELVALKAAPEKEALQADAELRQAELQLKTSEAKRESLKISPEGNNLFWVLAPRNGTVVELDVYANQEVTPDREKPLLKISELDEVLVLADVQEADVADLSPDAPVEVRTHSGVVKKGVVEHISEVVDPNRRTVEVRVRAPNQDHKLRPNGFAEIVFAAATATRRVRVPSEAVVTDGQHSVVFVAREPGKLEQVTVQTGRQRDGQMELLSGLAPGSRYVAKGALLLLNQIDLAH